MRKRKKKKTKKMEQFCHFKRKVNVDELVLTCVKEMTTSSFTINNLDNIRFRGILEMSSDLLK